LRAFLKRCKSRFQTTPDENFQQKEMAQSNRICGGWLCNFVHPTAGGLLFLLKLCFQILTALQKDEPTETDNGKQTNPRLCDRK